VALQQNICATETGTPEKIGSKKERVDFLAGLQGKTTTRVLGASECLEQNNKSLKVIVQRHGGETDDLVWLEPTDTVRKLRKECGILGDSSLQLNYKGFVLDDRRTIESYKICGGDVVETSTKL